VAKKQNKYPKDLWKNVPTYNPPGYEESKFNVVFDHHSHTIYSDGTLTVRQNVEWHKIMGYNALAITDHNNMRHRDDLLGIKEEYAQKGMILCSGFEWTTIRIHLNFLGISKWEDRVPYKPKDEKIIEVIEKVHARGGIVICNHILWSIIEAKYKNHPPHETLLDWGIDYIEIVNDDCLPENVYDQESYEFCLKNIGNIGMVTGTDMHDPYGLASGGVHGWTLLNLKEKTEEELIKELRKKNRTNIIYSQKPILTPPYHKNQRNDLN
jgi:hypothetical protein